MKTTITLFSLMIAITSYGMGRSSTLSLTGENLYPESISFRAQTQTLYVGSAGTGSIQTVNLPKGTTKVIQPAGTDGRTKTLGVKVDEPHHHLWAVDGAAVYLYDLNSNKLLKKNVLTDITPIKEVGSFVNDVAIDQQGNAYITDSFNPHILRVDGKTFEMTVWADVSASIPFNKKNDVAYNLNGIVISPDQKNLYSVKTNDGTLWKINIETKKVTEVKLAETVTKGDGLVWGKNQELYVIRNYENKISKINLGSHNKEKPVLTSLRADLIIPTSAVIVNGSLYVVNSQFDVKVPVPFALTQIPIDGLFE